ncbi:MAG: ABC transporter ATP-binding protein [Burkholderiaceae bacterium]
MTYALETRGLCKSFGALTVADHIDFQLEVGARHALIGPNGAGKTTFVNLLTGGLMPSLGQVFIAGEEVSNLSQSERVKKGLGRTFQINTLFGKMSVLDNVALGVSERLGLSMGKWKTAKSYANVTEEAMSLLELLAMESDAQKMVKDLPYGKQRLVEIAIALGLKPKVLLLDEPAAGVPSMESQRILSALDILPKDIAIMIIEHDMDLVFKFAKKITVLVQGAVLCEGTPQEVSQDTRVHQVYLGEQHA